MTERLTEGAERDYSAWVSCQVSEKADISYRRVLSLGRGVRQKIKSGILAPAEKVAIGGKRSSVKCPQTVSSITSSNRKNRIGRIQMYECNADVGMFLFCIFFGDVGMVWEAKIMSDGTWWKCTVTEREGETL